MAEQNFPEWPSGLWRRVVIQPGPGWIAGALEDDVHRFHLRIDHADGRIVAVHAEALRHPWTACPGAAPHLAAELAGASLAEIAARDPSQHCTHLFDLAVILAAHSADSAPSSFDMRVADRLGERTTATLHRDGAQILHWRLDGTAIMPGGDHAGMDLRQLSRWKQGLPHAEAEAATMLRRAVFVSGVRQYTAPATITADQSGGRMGVCFNYQLPQAATSTRRPGWITDFSAGAGAPLAGFDAARELAAMG